MKGCAYRCRPVSAPARRREPVLPARKRRYVRMSRCIVSNWTAGPPLCRIPTEDPAIERGELLWCFRAGTLLRQHGYELFETLVLGMA